MQAESKTAEAMLTSIPVVPPGRSYYLSLAVLTALPVLVMIIIAFAGLSEDLRPTTLPKALAVVVAIEIVVLALLLGLGRCRSAALTSEGLEIRAAMYRRSIPFSAMNLQNAQVVDLREKPGLRPRLKTNGYGLPGLAAGNFRDRNGDKIFCLVTAPRVLRLPLRDGSSVLLSAGSPDRALKLIQTCAAVDP